MRISRVTLAQLNQVLTNELTSINQYFLHARMFRNMGFEELNDKAYDKSILDMKQADKLIERILLLEGLPNLQHLEKLNIGEHPIEMLSCDLSFQQDQLPPLRHAISVCESEKDYVSRAILEEILKQEEDYLDWLETQQHLIEQTGEQNYLQASMEENG
ncbi:bacterioferritin [Paraferrimonas sedimenticola]|uniref:Bacterioferritin n=1 Tax=Paraferrimonas sedimenticola TaxID=375674 RepID=A0AA37RYD1_9GAMM|nr:bacterioferritin [Paraferrimonas sedimenticola]GLP97381.1 bacterioferritin [Paraferrimonas sedimenticola]